MVHDVLKQVNHKLVIPRLLVDAIEILAGIETDFIHVTDNVKAILLDHRHHLGEERPDNILDIVVEVLSHSCLECRIFTVDIHHFAWIVNGRNEMYRTDAVVQGQRLEIVAGRPVTHAHIVNLHRSIELDAVTISFAQTHHLVKVNRHIVFRHIARTLYRDRGMRRETQMSKALGDSFDHKLLHRCMTIAELRVGVQVI